MEHGLGGQDAAHRLGQRRHAAVHPHLLDLVEHLVQPVGRAQVAQPRVELGDHAYRHPVERCAQRDPRRDRRRRHLRRDVLVDEAGGAPYLVDVHAVLDAEAGQPLAQHLGGHPVQRPGDRIARGRDRLGAVLRGLDRHRHRVAAGALAVEADRDAGGLAQLVDHLVAGARVERAGRIVQQHVVGAQLGQPAGLVQHPRQVGHGAREGQAGVQRARPPRAPRPPPRPGSRRRSAGRAGGRSRCRSRRRRG